MDGTMKNFATIAMIAALTGCRAGLEVVEEGAAVIVRGARAELRVEDGRITSLRGPGCLCATGSVREPCGRVGLGVMTSAFNMSYTHWLYVSPLVDKNRPDERQQSYRSPEVRSIRKIVRGDGTVTIHWKGLSDGTAFHPDDELELTFGTDEAGAVTLKSRGCSPEGGVFGVLTPIEGIRDEGAFVLPFLGGMRFRIADMQKGVWHQYCDFVYCQAPVVAIEMPRGSFGVWSEDDAFHQFQIYYPKADQSAAFAFEWMNIMPYETKHEIVAPVLKIDAFPGKDWLGAATPYRNWFRRRFAQEIAVREQNTNPETAVAITSAWDRGKRFDDHLDELTNLFGRTIMFNHGKQTKESTRPPHRYDWGLPGHTPDLEYLKGINERHAHGIQCGCYAVAFCANYQSEVFKRDLIEEFAVPTINCAYMYRAMSPKAASAGKANGETETTQALQTMNNTLRDVATDVQPWDSPAEKWRKMNYKDQELVYLDVNSARWREYIVGEHKRLAATLDLDVLYEDCLGVIRDTGNGETDGTSGAMGSYLLARELQKAIPVAFQSEGGPAPVAMVSSYPLNSADFMRNKPKLLRHRFFHSVPLCAYLFGYRPLCGGHEAIRPVERNFVSCACSDALGGLGTVTEPPWNTQSGIFDHMVVRSLTFARKGLKPYFPEGGRMPDGVTCLYRDREGGIYRYCGETPVQVMYGPDGKPLWGRVSGVTEFDVPGLEFPDWPMRNGSRHYGLNADNYYALFPVRPNGKNLTQTYGEICEKEKLALAYDTPEFTYLELVGQKPKITFKTTESRPETSRVVSRASGIELYGVEKKLADAPRCSVRGVELLRIEGPAAFRTIDLVHTVRKGEAVRLVAQNREWGTWDSDGCLVGIYVNGRRQAEYDTAPEKNPKWVYQHAKRYLYDYRMHKMTVPLDSWAGETVLISVRIDAKTGTYDDRQDVSLPTIVPYAGEPLDEIVKGAVPESAYQHFNGGEPVRE